MKFFSKFTFKTILENKATAFVSFIGIILSATLLFSVGIMASSYRQNVINKAIQANGNQDVIIRDISSSKLDFFKNETLFKDYYYIQVLEDRNDIVIISVSSSFKGNIDLIGRLPQNDNEIVVDSNIKTNNNQITIDDVVYSVTGKFTNNIFKKYDKPVAIKYSEKMNDKVSVYAYVSNYKDANFKLRDFSSKINYPFNNFEINGDLFFFHGEVISDNPDALIEFSVLKVVVILIMTVVSFIIFFVIYNSFAIAINERKKRYGVYKTLGATPKQIIFSVLFEAFVISIFAIPLAFLLSIGFMQFILFIINNMLNLSGILKYTLEIYPSYILLSLFFIFAAIFLASFMPAIRASEVAPIEVVKQTTDIKVSKGLFKNNKLVKKLFGIEGVISTKNVIRNGRKYNVTTFSIVIAMLLFLMLSTFVSLITTSFKYSVEPVSIGIYENVNYTKILEDFTKSKYVKLYSVFGYVNNRVKTDASSFSDYFLKYNPYAVENGFILSYIDDNLHDEITSKYKLEKNTPIIFGNFHSEIDDITFKAIIKDKIDFETYDATGQNKLGNLLVSVIDDDSKDFDNLNFYVMLPLRMAKELDSLNLSITCNDYINYDKEIQQNLKEYTEISYYNISVENREQYLSMRVPIIITYIVFAFITLITVTTIINTLTIGMNLRTREFSILKSIGLTNKGFNKMILFEAISLTFKALLFSILFYIIIILLLLQLLDLGDMGADLILKIIPYSAFIYVTIGVFLIVYLSFIFASRKIKKMNIIDGIKEEIL